MADTDKKDGDTPKAKGKGRPKKGESSSKAAVEKKRKGKPVAPTAASSRPPRTKRAPNRFEFEEKAPTSRRAGVMWTRSSSRSPSRGKRKRSTSRGKGKKGKKGGKRAKKDPNAPKKNLSAFMFFSNANRDDVKKHNPDADFGEIGKLLGKAWRKASKSEKKKFDALAEKDKKRYQKEKEKYEKEKESEKESESEGSGKE